MLFLLKKFLGYCVMPVPFCLGVLIVGTLLLWNPRRYRLGRALIGFAVVFFLLISNGLVSRWLVWPIETRYPPIPDFAADATLPPNLAACRYVVVLGGGNGNTPGESALDELSPSARARITEAVRLLRLLPEARLIVSGPADETRVTHATFLERSAISLGVDAARITRIEHARDTEDESLAVKRRVADAPVALVTSAWHMPRAVALFRAAGVDVVPCPTDFTAHSDGQFYWRNTLWDVESIERSTVAIRERIGYLWVWLRGKG
jgi:uncharacterized SAM-binding protein YcdF (DUF218 family)